MSREDDDEDMAYLEANQPDSVWFYSEDGVWFAVGEPVAYAMTRKLIGPYVLER